MSDRLILPSELLAEGRVLLDVIADSKKRIFEEIGLAFENTGGPPKGIVFKKLLERERLGSTTISDGAAVPHARLEELGKPLAAYLRTLEPIMYDSSSDMSVRHMFILLAPDKADDAHLKILSVVSRMLTDQDFVKAAEECTDRAGFLKMVAAWELDHLPAAAKDKSAAA